MRLPLAPQPPLPVAAAESYAELALAASAGPFPGVTEHRDIEFGSDPWESADIFLPEGATAPVDLVVFFHGGGWTNGYKEWCGFMAPGLAARGMGLVAPSYRLTPGVRWPDFLFDALRALAAIPDLMARLGAEQGRILVAGHSAGGHIAAMAALRTDLWPQVGLAAGAIAGCLPISGILDLHHPDPPAGSLEERVYHTVLDDPALDHEASPLSWLDRLAMPLVLAWGAGDTERVRRSNALAATRLGVRVQTMVWPEDHFGTHLALRDPDHPWYEAADRMRRQT